MSPFQGFKRYINSIGLAVRLSGILAVVQHPPIKQEPFLEIVFWDWNGTLLNDVHTCIDAMNVVLSRRKMSLLNFETYRQIFTFPIINYYEKLGFDFSVDPFHRLAEEYLFEYDLLVQKATLYPGALETLVHLHSKGYSQSILSAMRQADLLNQVENAKINSWFKEIIGLQDIYAKSKIENAIQYIKKNDVNPADICMIGDTYHDYEVSIALGCRCILISNGHQHLRNSFHKDVKVLSNILDVRSIL
jgi:phosphoglycolate phosphatase